MGTHNIRLYKEVDRKYTGYNLKTGELLDSAHTRVCAIIRLNTVCFCGEIFITILLLSGAIKYGKELWCGIICGTVKSLKISHTLFLTFLA